MPEAIRALRVILRGMWIAVRRAPKDGLARKNLLRLTFSLLIFIAFLSVYFFFFYGSWHDLGPRGTIFAIVPWIALSLVIGLVVRWRQNAEQRAVDRASPAVSPEMKRELFREACLLAILLERLGSESYMEKEIPPEVTIVTRRVLLDRLAALGLRDNLEPWILDLLLAPDGHWTAEQKQRAIPAWECFSVFRWVLGLGELRDLTADPKYSVAEARSLVDVKEPEKLMALPSWDARPARNAAGFFLNRCWAELVARGAVSTAEERDVESALAVRAEIEQKGYTGDYLIGARTISELETPLLFSVTRRAFTRWRFLSVLVDILAGDAPIEQLRRFLSQYFAPADVAERLNADASA